MKELLTVIFDLDGTLIDTEKYYRIFWPKALAHFGCHLTDEQALSLRSVGRPFAPAKFREWFGPGLDYEAVRAYRKQIMESYLEKVGIDLKPGALELLSWMKGCGDDGIPGTGCDDRKQEAPEIGCGCSKQETAGASCSGSKQEAPEVGCGRQKFQTAIATATDRVRAEKYLAGLGLLPFFDRVVCATQVKEGKPAPDIYLFACRELGKKPEDCFAVEDSPNGILSAYRAGCKVIMVPDQTEPDEELSRLLYARLDNLADLIPFFSEKGF